jgi:hypothetical protein
MFYQRIVLTTTMESTPVVLVDDQNADDQDQDQD